MLDAGQLDDVYTETCRAMTTLGPHQAELFLARLTLLLMKEVGDSARIVAAIDAARNSVAAG